MGILSISTFNCKNFKGTITKNYCRELLDDSDFLLIQEHWLYEENFHKFDEINKNINICKNGKSAMNSSVIRSGRPHGGCMILWRDSIEYNIQPIQTISSKLNCNKVICNLGFDFLLFNVYMPTDDRISNNSNIHNSNINELQDVLAEISIICQSNPTSFIIAAGDFNCDFGRDSLHVNELKQFCTDQGLESCGLLPCSNVDYTFECKKSKSRSHIDHILISSNIREYVINCMKVDSVDNDSDHIAVKIELDLHCDYFASKEISHTPRPTWYKVSIDDKSKYQQELDHLYDINCPTDAFECKDINCSNHNEKLEKVCIDIINSCIVAGQMTIPHIGTKNKDNNQKAGWNEYCREKKEESLYWHRAWKIEGSKHNTFLAHMRIKSRLQYHYAVRCIDKNRDAIKSEKMAQNCIKNRKNMWDEAKRMRGNNRKVPQMVDNTVGDSDISKLFSTKFNHILTSVGYNNEELDEIKSSVTKSIQEKCHINEDNVDQNGNQLPDHNETSDDFFNQGLLEDGDVEDALTDLSSGKSDGNLGIFSDHFLLGTKLLWRYLTLLFNSMLVHGFTPSQFRIGTIIPIIKNKKESSSNSDNFRGICLQSSLCKLMDIIILKKECKSLQTSELQFGFKKGLSANVAASIVQETIYYYINTVLFGTGCIQSL